MINKKVTILDYGFGNVFSLINALKYLKTEVEISNDPKQLLNSDRIIITGVCAFSACINNMKEKGLDDMLKQFAKSDKPILGICIGMQILFERSTEFGLNEGLSLIPGEIRRIPDKDLNGNNLKVPHMGWSEIIQLDDSLERNNGIMGSIKPNRSAYFAHSFSAQNMKKENIVAVADYGGNNLNAIVQRDYIFGTQFHPEKSHNFGLKILENFLNI